MLTTMYVEINIFAIVILLLIFLNIQNQKEKYLYEQKIYMMLLYTNAMMLVFDTLMWVLNGQSGLWAWGANILASELYYLLAPVPCILWSFYADYQIHRDKMHIKKMLPPFLIPIVVNTIFSILSIFGNFFFYIDQNNIYHRGEWFYLMVAISYFYFLYTFVSVIVNMKKIGEKKFLSLLMFPVLPCIAGVLQIAFYGVSLIWTSMTISMLIIFINIQNKQLYTDHLTGLFNRKQFDNYLLDKSKGNLDDKMFAGIMMDINFFKDINDRFGHLVGDQALQATAEILQKSINKNDFVARYGGDEFVAIIEINQYSDLTETINRIRKNISNFNMQKKVPYTISLSMGYDIYDYNAGVSLQEFIKDIDRLMYQEKKRMKNKFLA